MVFKALFIKDLKKFLSGIKLYIFTLLIFPIALSILYGAIYKNQVNPEVKLPKIKVVILNKDKGIYAKKLEMVFKNSRVKSFIDVKYIDNFKSIQAKIEDGSVSAAIIIPENFSDRIDENKKTNIEMIKSPIAGEKTEVVYEIINSYLDVLNNNSAVAKTLKENTNDKKRLEEVMPRLLVRVAKLSTDNYSTTTNFELEKKITARQYYASAMLAFTGFFITLVTASIMTQEIKTGTMSRMMSTTVNYFQLFIEKIVFCFVITIVFICVYVGIRFMLGNNFGGKGFEVFITILFQAFAMTGLASLLMSIFKKTKTMNTICMPFIMLYSAFGGAFYYVDEAAVKFKYMKLTLNYWITDAYNKIALGYSIKSVFVN